MNQWKRELDKTAGSFKSEKERLMQGVMMKKNKEQSKKLVLRGALTSLIVAVLGIFIYHNFFSNEQSAGIGKKYILQYATPEEPFYLDEAAFQFYQAMYHDSFFNGHVSSENSAVKQQLLDSAFQVMITQQALELEAYYYGFRMNEQLYNERLAEIREQMDSIPKNEIERYADVLDMNTIKFVEQVYLPTYTKFSLYNEFMNDKIDNFTFEKFIASEQQYKSEIEAMAKQLNVEYIPREDISAMYEGVIAAIEGNDLLVVSDMPVEIEQLSRETIEALYPNHFWFTHENLVGIEVGSKVRIVYDLRTLKENRANIISIEILAE